MGYGVNVTVTHACGHELIVVDYDADPPPIPMRVPAGVTSDTADGRWLHECPACGAHVDGDELLGRVQ